MSSALISSGIANASGTGIKACYKKSNGSLRVITGKQKCTSSEKSISWGTTGAAGSRGATGPAGAAGSNGYSNSYHYMIPFGETPHLDNYMMESSEVTQVWMKAIPAGSYTFSISTQAAYSAGSTHTGNAFLKCMLTSKDSYSEAVANRQNVVWPLQYWSGAGRPYIVSFQPALANEEQIVGFSAVSTITLSQATKLRLVCAMDQGKRNAEPSDEQIDLWYLSLVFTAVNSDTQIEQDPMN